MTSSEHTILHRYENGQKHDMDDRIVCLHYRTSAGESCFVAGHEGEQMRSLAHFAVIRAVGFYTSRFEAG